jgi:hypothetical protein
VIKFYVGTQPSGCAILMTPDDMDAFSRSRLKSAAQRSLRLGAAALALAGLGSWGVLQAQKPFRQYWAVEYHDENELPLPPDWNQKTEWTRARLKYPAIWNLHGELEGGPPGPDGSAPYNWTIDYPRSDRHLLAGIRRLTRIDTRSVEQIVELDGTDDIYNWPMVYGVEVGHWNLTDEQAAQMRDFLLRGGFFMCDDFHGTMEWNVFTRSMNKIFPDRKIVDIPNNDPIFHVIYDLDDRFQVPGWQWSISHLTYEYDGFEPRWRGIYDDKGRIMVAICHNMDLGDAWEWSDDPRYPEKWAGLAYRIAVNYVTYDLTH